MISGFRLMPVAALLLAGGCAYDTSAQGYDPGYAPNYPPGYDSGMGSGQAIQPGDLFGGQNVQSVEAFDRPLSQYGQWVDSRYGRAFLPNAPQGWRPYTNGRWGEDRLWISDDPWGWATDHYGRWGFDQRINAWVWVPGTEWAPSWVAWREADDVTGWAPIPPNVSYSISVGFGGGFGYDNYDSWYQPSWVWVPRAYLYQPRFGGRILGWDRGQDYWRGSRWNYNSGWNGRPGYNRPGGWHAGPGVNYGGNGYGRPNDGRPGYGRPGDGDGRPGYGDGRPGYGRPGNNNGYGRPGVSGAIGGSLAGVPQRPGYNGQGNWQGRPDGGQPGSNPAQGRPGAPDGNGGYQRPRPGNDAGSVAVIRGNELGNLGRPGGYPNGYPNGYQRPNAGQQPNGGQAWQGRPGGYPGQPSGGRPAYQGNGQVSGQIGGAMAGGMNGARPQQQPHAMPQLQRPAPPPPRPAPPPPRSEQREQNGNHGEPRTRPQ